MCVIYKCQREVNNMTSKSDMRKGTVASSMTAEHFSNIRLLKLQHYTNVSFKCTFEHFKNYNFRILCKDIHSGGLLYGKECVIRAHVKGESFGDPIEAAVLFYLFCFHL
jgi:hypothetical protein